MITYEAYSAEIRLEFGQVQAKHYGNYTLLGYLPEASYERNITLQLRVKSQPKVSNVLQSVDIDRGKPETVEFRVTGYPVRNCTPSYNECPDGGECTEAESITKFTSRSLPPGNVVLVSVEIDPKKSGKLTCTMNHSKATVDVYVKAPKATAEWAALGITFVILAVVAVCLVLQVRRIRRKKRELRQVKQNMIQYFGEGRVNELDPDGTVREQAQLLPYDPAWEVNRRDIQLGKQLGSGSFGRVVLASVRGLDDANDGETEAAVKMVKSHVDVTHLESLMVELKILSHLGKHINIVNMLGANTVHLNRGELWILTEYCRYGNLLDFIRKHESKFIHQVDSLRDEIDPRILVNNPASSRFSRSVTIRTRTMMSATSIATDISIGTQACTPAALQGQHNPKRAVHFHNPTYTSVPPADDGADDGADESESGSTSSRDNAETIISDLTAPSSGHDYLSMDLSTTCTSGYQEGIPGISILFNTSALVCWAWQVAQGMSYLAQRKILHGDLAARNLLLADENVVKISDFGLSRNMHGDIYQKKRDDLLPIKWLSIEAIRNCTFSVQSDIWAYGVTLWELFTLGSTPYPGVPVDANFLGLLEGGYRMSKPTYATKKIHELILRTWSLHPSDRPTFEQISQELSLMLQRDLQEHYVSMNEGYQKMNEAWFKERVDYLNLFRSPEFEFPATQEELGVREAREGLMVEEEEEEEVGDKEEEGEVGIKEEEEEENEEQKKKKEQEKEKEREKDEEEEEKRKKENEDDSAHAYPRANLQGLDGNERGQKTPDVSSDYMQMI
ncbi:macrophage colony-stimulating factor 1 receptor-like isoform X2 [Penaeus monodon]|nr:macrophage colony-stimulating factor 1 receptor-like isoform X2 [Penaeus monodon]